MRPPVHRPRTPSEVAPTVPHDDGRRADPRVISNRVDLHEDWLRRLDGRGTSAEVRLRDLEDSADGLTRSVDGLVRSTRRAAVGAFVVGLVAALLAGGLVLVAGGGP